MLSPRTLSNDQRHSDRDAVDEDEAARPYACPLPSCSRKFKRRFTLKEHIKTHTGEKSFKCPVPSCCKSFTTSGNLSRHKRLHPWLETTFECLIVGCGCTFASETKLERHMSMAHFGHSTHLCAHANCGGAFSTAGNLKRHLRQHHAHDGGSSSPANSELGGEEKARVAQYPPRGIFSSPVAVDSFAASNTNSRGQKFIWSTTPDRDLLRLRPVLPPPLHDGDLLEALGYLFQPDSNCSAIV